MHRSNGRHFTGTSSMEGSMTASISQAGTPTNCTEQEDPGASASNFSAPNSESLTAGGTGRLSASRSWPTGWCPRHGRQHDPENAQCCGGPSSVWRLADSDSEGHGPSPGLDMEIPRSRWHGPGDSESTKGSLTSGCQWQTQQTLSRSSPRQHRAFRLTSCGAQRARTGTSVTPRNRTLRQPRIRLGPQAHRTAPSPLAAQTISGTGSTASESEDEEAQLEVTGTAPPGAPGIAHVCNSCQPLCGSLAAYYRGPGVCSAWRVT
jgi:hypothetical protein